MSIIEYVTKNRLVKELITHKEHIEVPLSKGFSAMIDKADAKKIEGLNFYYHKSVKGSPSAMVRFPKDESGKRKSLMMHRLIKPGFKFYSFKDGNTLNYRRDNILTSNHFKIAVDKESKHKVNGYRNIYKVKKDPDQYVVIVSGKYVKSSDSLERAVTIFNEHWKNIKGHKSGLQKYVGES